MTKEKVWKILTSILMIAIFIYMIGSIQASKSEIKELDIQQTKLMAEKVLLQSKFNDLEFEQQKIKYTIADAWMSMQSESTKDSFESFAHPSCDMIEEDVRVLKNWYSLEDFDFFNVMSIQYNLGHQVYYPNGEIKCFEKTINDMNPENISCDELCQN
jgi:hypothetical protein